MLRNVGIIAHGGAGKTTLAEALLFHAKATDRLGKVRVPALILCGTEDRSTPLQYSETLATGIPGAALQTIDGAGHMVMLEQPRRVAGALTLFIKTIPYTPGG